MFMYIYEYVEKLKDYIKFNTICFKNQILESRRCLWRRVHLTRKIEEILPQPPSSRLFNSN